MTEATAIRRHSGRGRAPIGRRYNRAMSRPPDHDQEHDHGVAVETGKPEVARPPLYSVLLLNDDYTPMDFVIDVLIRFFGMNLDKATQVMLHVHTRGRGVCGRSDEHTSELQSLMRISYAVFCLKTKKQKQQ